MGIKEPPHEDELSPLIEEILEEKEPLQSNYPQMIAEILYRPDQPGNNPIG